MTTEELIERYIENSGQGHRKLPSCSFDGDTFYSYNHAICRRIASDVYVIRRDGYSRTTIKHVRAVQRATPKNTVIIADWWDGSPIDLGLFAEGLETHMRWRDKELKYATTRSDLRISEDELEIALRNLRIWEANEKEIYEYATI